jgi:hypothetical protein
MKGFRYLILGVALMSITLGAFAQQAPPAAPAQPPQAAPAADRTFQGELGKVDAEAKTIIVSGTGNKQMTFAYDDKTQMVGIEKNNIQGLASKPGTNLRVTYRDEKGTNHATRIEVVPAAPPKQ